MITSDQCESLFCDLEIAEKELMSARTRFELIDGFDKALRRTIRSVELPPLPPVDSMPELHRLLKDRLFYDARGYLNDAAGVVADDVDSALDLLNRAERRLVNARERLRDAERANTRPKGAAI